MPLKGNFRPGEDGTQSKRRHSTPDSPASHFAGEDLRREMQRPKGQQGLPTLIPRHQGYHRMNDPDAPSAYFHDPRERRELPSGKRKHRLPLPDLEEKLPAWQRSTKYNEEEAVLLNRFGLRYRTAEKYPALFQASVSIFWKPMSDEERQELIRTQAAAQERVGYEKGTKKFFIPDFVPDGMAVTKRDNRNPEEYNPTEYEYEERRNKFRDRKQEEEDRRRGKHRKRPARANDSGFNPIMTLPSVKSFIEQGGSLNSGRGGIFAGKAGRVEHGYRPPLDVSEMDFPGLVEMDVDESYDPLIRGEGTFMTDKENASGQGGQQSQYRNIPVQGSEGPGSLDRPSHPLHSRIKAKPLTQSEYTPASDALDKYGSGQKKTGQPAGWRGKGGKVQTGGGVNRFGLTSRAESKYPEAFNPVDSQLWTGLTPLQRKHLTHLQAIAMEKVGFEKSAPKFFIEDFDPGDAHPETGEYQRKRDKLDVKPSQGRPTAASRPDDDLVRMAAPRLILSGALLGAGGLSLILALASVLVPIVPIAVAAVIALGFGGVLAMRP